ncbi:hypothetical protein ACHAO4_004721 [Trichoderma viride]
MKVFAVVGGLIALLPTALACGSDDSCYGPTNTVEHVRHVKRIQPGAPNAKYGPKGPLEWGQLNILHTTDSHGWLEGHLKEQNYGADWGDFATFSRRMKQAAHDMNVDMLLVDTGDLHDGNGISDATKVDGTKSMPIFNEVDYDLLTIGNHELYMSEVSYEMFNIWAKKWGERYITSNVKVLNKTSGNYEYVGATHRYFKTEKGLRIMAFGVLFDFTGNSNASQVIKAKDLIKEPWFNQTLATSDPIDVFILLGHNPVSQKDPVSTFKVVFDEIRKHHPVTPIQILGGHTHIRNFSVYDDNSVALESGRYCETLGWLSMSGFNSSNSGFTGPKNPKGVANPSRPARPGAKSPFVYFRRYLDWNRQTFVYHTKQTEKTFDQAFGLNVTGEITKVREELKLGQVFGCAPQTWCLSCVPYDNPSNIYPGVIVPAASTIVVNKARENKSRIIIGNTAGVRFDLHKGPFTYDDSIIVSFYRDVFFYIPDVPYALAKTVLPKLNKPKPSTRDDNLPTMPVPRDSCTDPSLGYLARREMQQGHGVVRRQETVTSGYVTTDDWGTDGDDTKHTKIPDYPIPKYWQAEANFPMGKDPEFVDLVFYDYLQKSILTDLGANYTAAMVNCYIDCNFTSQDFLIPYVKLIWQKNINNCSLES